MDSFKLIEQFGSRLGVALKRDPNGVYVFEIDGRTFSIHDLCECDRIVLCGDLGHPPPECREKLCVALLEAQYMLKNTAGATFSIDPETERFSLCKVLVSAVLDTDGFFTEAENFINALHTWAAVIQNFRPETPAASEENRNYLDSGFLSV